MERCDGGGAADEKARRKAKRTKTLLQVAMIYIYYINPELRIGIYLSGSGKGARPL